MTLYHTLTKVMKSFTMKLTVYGVKVVLKNREENICAHYYIKYPEHVHLHADDTLKQITLNSTIPTIF